jgi:hypothetical protein
VVTAAMMPDTAGQVILIMKWFFSCCMTRPRDDGGSSSHSEKNHQRTAGSSMSAFLVGNKIFLKWLYREMVASRPELSRKFFN